MANRDNHYEAAFEAYLRSRGLPYVAVDEAKRSVLGDGESIKNLDFIVSTPGTATWLVDVKGRRFPSAEDQYWK
ncbi:MAG: HYExAFE family protein, partial [Thermoguttaceae bacterium]